MGIFNFNAKTSEKQQGEGDSPRICTTRGCGFLVSVEHQGYCSKCHKKSFIRECLRKRAESNFNGHNEHSGYIKRKPEDRPNINCDQAVVYHPTCVNNKHTLVQTPVIKKQPRKKNNRCLCCNKKVGLLGFSCRCGGDFCGSHRHPESHTCDFDFKTAGKMKIEKENLVIKADKLVHRI